MLSRIGTAVLLISALLQAGCAGHRSSLRFWDTGDWSMGMAVRIGDGRRDDYYMKVKPRRVSLDIRLEGFLAETVCRMTIPNRFVGDLAEAWWDFSLPEKPVVTGLKLDVQGMMVPGVGVEYILAADAYRTEVRGRVDPALQGGDGSWTRLRTILSEIPNDGGSEVGDLADFQGRPPGRPAIFATDMIEPPRRSVNRFDAPLLVIYSDGMYTPFPTYAADPVYAAGGYEWNVRDSSPADGLYLAGRLFGDYSKYNSRVYYVSETTSVAIEEISAGHTVLGFHPETGAIVPAEVAGAHSVSYSGDLVSIAYGSGSLRATGNHPVLVLDGPDLADRPPPSDLNRSEARRPRAGRWVEARSLKVGDLVLGHDGSATPVASIDLSIIDEYYIAAGALLSSSMTTSCCRARISVRKSRERSCP